AKRRSTSGPTAAHYNEPLHGAHGRVRVAETDSTTDDYAGLSIEDLQQRVRDLRILKDFAETMLGHRGDIGEALWEVTQQAISRLRLEDCVIYVLDEEQGDLVQAAAFGPKNPKAREILNPIRIALGRGIVGSVAVSGQVELIEDTRLDPRYIQDDQLRLSELAVPIVSSGRVVGVIDSEHSVKGFFTPWHRDIFVSVAAMVAGRMAALSVAEKRRRLITHDALTGLLNRSEFLRRIQERLDAADDGFALIFLDLDHFGVFNDTLGHIAGDELLRALAQRIQDVTPGDAITGRFGGDEFVVVVNGDLVVGGAVASEIVRAINQHLNADVATHVRVTCSAGVAMTELGDSAMELINRADLAMYQAKSAGRNRVHLHDATLAAARRREQRLVVELERALESKDSPIEVLFQPIYGVAQRVPVACEALARWSHPTLGAISPADFIGIAERTGKIHALGRQLFRLALLGRRSWPSSASAFMLNINVSPLQLRHDDFLADLMRSLKEFDVLPGQVACEITETALLADDDRTKAAVHGLIDHGVKLVLDDFGTGYASLATLTRYPFSGVKIDRRFVRDLASNAQARAIVRSVVSLASDLALGCTAEGVEHQVDFDALRELGCPMAQGQWLCEPMSAEQMRQLLCG
ncbi:MAG: putative bifunctional diguanylate cyclase/phosphodiesterase, partial [Steroidobacteraceae bacterium]